MSYPSDSDYIQSFYSFYLYMTRDEIISCEYFQYKIRVKDIILEKISHSHNQKEAQRNVIKFLYYYYLFDIARVRRAPIRVEKRGIKMCR